MGIWRGVMIKAKSFGSDSAKLTQDSVEEIYIELREGTSYNAIAKMFNVSCATIQNVNNGKYFRIPDMIYPIRDTKTKELISKRVRKLRIRNEREGSTFWDSYIPEPVLEYRKSTKTRMD